MKYQFDRDHPYFFSHLDGVGTAYFSSREERDEYMTSYVADSLIYDNWPEGMEAMTAGEVTHSVVQFGRVDRPADLDDDSIDEEGRYWDSDWDYVCNYRMEPISEDSEDSDNGQ